ncbi:sialin-like isoform X2 [Parasteatoda tepidariorum]|uniref:sialin-like isoform X2 n=1 Tax=Parasteatoda tepidariorum TaxID=114398 RepID=UPI0039BC956E
MQNVKEIQNSKGFESKKMITFYFPRRYVLIILGFLGMVSVYTMRVNLSVALVAMVNQTTTSSSNGSLHEFVECPNLLNAGTQTESTQFKGTRYNWDSKVQGTILGSFFYGYILTQVPGGVLAERFGGKWLFGVGTFITAVFSILTPLAASLGTTAFIVVRVLEGIGEGVTFPAMNYLISTWAPMTERSRFSTIIFTGNPFGNVIAMPISGLLSSASFLGGWPAVFYVFGGLGCIWFVFWSFLVYETPDRHPTISKEELFLIEQNNDEKLKQKPAVPWRDIFTSIPMWALIIAHTGHNFGYYLLMTEMPTYLNNILHFDLKSNGFLSAIPYIAQGAAAWVASFIADRLRVSETMSITSIRKLFQIIGVFGPACCLLLINISGCRPQLIVALLTLGMGFNGCIYSGFNVTHVDMCPDFAGTAFAITNAVANLMGIIGPLVVGYFTATGSTIHNWSEVFYTAAAVYFVSGAIFAIFGSAEVQQWGTATVEVKEEKNEKKLSIIPDVICSH